MCQVTSHTLPHNHHQHTWKLNNNKYIHHQTLLVISLRLSRKSWRQSILSLYVVCYFSLYHLYLLIFSCRCWNICSSWHSRLRLLIFLFSNLSNMTSHNIYNKAHKDGEGVGEVVKRIWISYKYFWNTIYFIAFKLKFTSKNQTFHAQSKDVQYLRAMLMLTIVAFTKNQRHMIYRIISFYKSGTPFLYPYIHPHLSHHHCGTFQMSANKSRGR